MQTGRVQVRLPIILYELASLHICLQLVNMLPTTCHQNLKIPHCWAQKVLILDVQQVNKALMLPSILNNLYTYPLIDK